MIIEHGKKYTLMLTVTEKCNLNCVYCYEGVKSEKIMPFEVAKKAVTDTFNLLDESDTLIITFHGGEPLTAFGLIKKFVIGSGRKNGFVTIYFLQLQMLLYSMMK